MGNYLFRRSNMYLIVVMSTTKINPIISKSVDENLMKYYHFITHGNFVCLGLISFLNIWGRIATVPDCSRRTLTNVLPHRNAIPQTQDMTPQSVTVYRHRAWNTQLPISMSWVRPDREILPLPSTHTSECSTLWCCYSGSQSKAQ